MQLDSNTMRAIIQQLIVLILSIAVHEFGHAFVADRLGDRLPRSQGRVTLNPIAHADPIGTLALPAMFLLMSGGASMGFGWGRPVQVNPLSFSRRFTMRTGHMMVAAAGPAMNILFGTAIAVLIFVLIKSGVLTGATEAQVELLHALHGAVLTNFVLAFFNLIPFPPLDGGAVIEGLLPRSALASYQRVAQYGTYIIIALIMLPKLSIVFTAPARMLHGLVIGALFGFPTVGS